MVPKTGIAIPFYGNDAFDDSIFRLTSRVRPDRRGEYLMKATLVIVENDKDHQQAKALLEKLMNSADPSDQGRLVAQARLIEAYEQGRWPRRIPSLPEILSYLMDQHGLTRAELAEFLGTPSRSEVMTGKRRQKEIGLEDRVGVMPASSVSRSRSRREWQLPRSDPYGQKRTFENGGAPNSAEIHCLTVAPGSHNAGVGPLLMSESLISIRMRYYIYRNSNFLCM
jgi:HTH-type transcriptional regulator / antitoxin HigA